MWFDSAFTQQLVAGFQVIQQKAEILPTRRIRISYLIDAFSGQQQMLFCFVSFKHHRLKLISIKVFSVIFSGPGRIAVAICSSSTVRGAYLLTLILTFHDVPRYWSIQRWEFTVQQWASGRKGRWLSEFAAWAYSFTTRVLQTRALLSPLVFYKLTDQWVFPSTMVPQLLSVL